MQSSVYWPHVTIFTPNHWTTQSATSPRMKEKIILNNDEDNNNNNNNNYYYYYYYYYYYKY